VPGPDTVAEESAPAITLSLTLFSLLTWAVSWGLLLGWQNTFAPMLEGIANAVRISKFGLHLDPAKKLRDLDHLVQNELQKAIDAGDLAMGFWWHQTTRIQLWMVDETWKIARDTLHFGEWVVHSYGPTLLKIAGTVTFPWPKLYRVIDSEIEKFLPKVGKIAHGAADVTEAELGKFERGIDRRLVKQAGLIAGLGVALGAIAGGLVWPHPGGTFTLPKAWRGLTKRLARIEARLHRLEGLLAAAGMAVAMANVLGVSAKCLRKGPIGKVSRSLCGIPTHLLDDLLGILADIWIVENVCVLLPFLETAASKIGTPLVEALTVAGAGICPGHSAPKPLLGPKATVPDLIFGVSASAV
jgi:hypothetical protein